MSLNSLSELFASLKIAELKEQIEDLEYELNAAKEKIASLEADLRFELSGVEPEEQSDELTASSKN